ncbi:hypothetical protein B0H14DRAFT_2577661 [Mycena olivaceomarginata]|nr:hypothetical protein B0H14DRAFT_2577661 [Mycena olivaceomarginata]
MLGLELIPLGIQAIYAALTFQAVAFYDPNLTALLLWSALLELEFMSAYPAAGSGGGEPLNVIISGLSSPEVLTDAGLLHYAQAIGFSFECLGIHLGDPQSANLGDGNGWVNQTVCLHYNLSIELRQDFGDDDIGTCLESLVGGNHFRVFRQNGTLANSGALFLAVSQEEDVWDGHTIIPDGYNAGLTYHERTTYSTVARNLTGLLPAGSTGVNHGIATDGITVLLTVTIVGK